MHLKKAVDDFDLQSCTTTKRTKNINIHNKICLFENCHHDGWHCNFYAKNIYKVNFSTTVQYMLM